MTILRACAVLLMLLGFAAPIGLAGLAQPAYADDGGDSGDGSDDDDAGDEPAAEQPAAPDVDFSTLDVGAASGLQDVHSTFRSSTRH
jgi:hypothetical protein